MKTSVLVHHDNLTVLRKGFMLQTVAGKWMVQPELNRDAAISEVAMSGLIGPP